MHGLTLMRHSTCGVDRSFKPRMFITGAMLMLKTVLVVLESTKCTHLILHQQQVFCKKAKEAGGKVQFMAGAGVFTNTKAKVLWLRQN